MSGQGRYRDSWSFFYPDVDGIIFMVDATDKERLHIVKEVLASMATHPSLVKRKIPMIVLCNKTDQPDAIHHKDLEKFVEMS